MSKGGQQVGPSVGPIARLKDENRDLKLRLRTAVNNGAEDLLDMKKHYQAEVNELVQQIVRLKKEAFDYRDGFIEANAELVLLREVLEAAEAVEGPGEWVHDELKPAVTRLHKAIRKVKGM